jgi:hypothetical protein
MTGLNLTVSGIDNSLGKLGAKFGLGSRIISGTLSDASEPVKLTVNKTLASAFVVGTQYEVTPHKVDAAKVYAVGADDTADLVVREGARKGMQWDLV